MVEGEPLDLLCTADGYPRPAFDISLDKNGTKPTVMALAGTSAAGSNTPLQIQSGVSESYRIIGLTPEDNGRNITCQVDMKHIEKNLSLSSTKQLYIECKCFRIFDFHLLIENEEKRQILTRQIVIYSWCLNKYTIDCSLIPHLFFI